MTASAPAIPDTAIDSAFQNPIVYGLLLLLVVLYLLSEVTGLLKGPINAVIMRRRAAAPVGGPDLAALERTVATLMEDAVRDRARITAQDERIAQQDAEILDLRAGQHRGNELLAAHTRWDRIAQQALVSAGIEIPAPPPVYDTQETP